ncbi:MAG: hypothetical protein Q8S53_13220 [Brevundimonas sp.]|uniref:hypothetical protein n=1 Tax=Brevundimonas sp. TaxID=1871086 RepID=UPI00273732CE|nr:hypothetical protein [Brevundimonas sp.]MDP3379317.1 hypothetical protein [Brevundimonas sp.]
MLQTFYLKCLREICYTLSIFLQRHNTSKGYGYFSNLHIHRLTQEEKEDGDRRRPIIEPTINDIIAKYADEFPQLCATTAYTSKADIRRAVFETTCAAQFDFAAWFDQIPLDALVSRLFGLQSSLGIFELLCVAMGFRPACQIAQAATNSIAAVRGPIFTASCVDNVAFMGSRSAVVEAAREFIVRSSTVGAQIKDTTINVATEYDFLGEHYDHARKTRRLTDKTAAKAAFAATVLQRTPSLRTKQIQAIFGLLLYAANTLRITIAKFHWAMRFLSLVCAQTQDTEHTLRSDVRAELLAWAMLASENKPVAVHTPELEPEFVIYTDASATGWGAISTSRGGNVIRISQPWSAEELEHYNVHSSVVAEPLAIRKAVAALVPTSAKSVQIFTDHLPFVFAYKSTFGRAWSYSAAVQFLSTYSTIFDVQFVPGEQNPADVLSRARHLETPAPPPILMVTSVAGTPLRGRRERVYGRDGSSRAFGT